MSHTRGSQHDGENNHEEENINTDNEELDIVYLDDDILE
jgi:hypothetical protein